MITKKDVEHVANLARLDLSEEEKEKLTQDLIKILGHCQRLQKVNTDGVFSFRPEGDRPLAEDLRETHLTNQTRTDEAQDSGIQEDILKLAPKRKGDYFEVKEVLE